MLSGTVINSNKFKKNDIVCLTFDFFDKSTLENATPLYIDIVEPKTANSVNSIWNEQYELRDLKSILTFSADFKPGNYILTAGFYFLNEINSKYPTFYLKKFYIEIQ